MLQVPHSMNKQIQKGAQLYDLTWLDPTRLDQPFGYVTDYVAKQQLPERSCKQNLFDHGQKLPDTSTPAWTPISMLPHFTVGPFTTSMSLTTTGFIDTFGRSIRNVEQDVKNTIATTMAIDLTRSALNGINVIVPLF